MDARPPIRNDREQLEFRIVTEPRPRSPRKRTSSTRRNLPVAGLFAGIGGIELGLRRAGHSTNVLCEIDPGAIAVLRRHFRDVTVHEDVRTLEVLPEGTKVLAAGFPCQDLSQAGKTVGITGARSGLVGEVFRLAERNHVPWLVFENVSFMLSLDKGRALSAIVERLENLGYSWAYRVVDSRAFGVPQRRERVFIVAARDDDPRSVLFADDASPPDDLDSREVEPGIAYGFYWTEGVRGLGWARDCVPTLKGGSTVGVPSPPAIWLPSGEIVTPNIRDAERLQGFRADWTKPAQHVVGDRKRWHLVGNAVTVPVARWVGERLAQPGDIVVQQGRPIRTGDRWPSAAWNAGSGRYTALATKWPKARNRKSLTDFLEHSPARLSIRATEGFLRRTEGSNLRFPAGFIQALESHLARLSTL